MEKKSTIKTLKIVLIVFISYFLFDYPFKNHFSDFRDWFDAIINEKTISLIVAYSLLTVPLILGVGVIHKFKSMWSALGLNRSFLQGMIVAFLGTLPMLIGFLCTAKFNSEVSFHWIIYGAVVAAFFEELIFRGILFGQLFRYTKIGFILVILIVSILFALGHLYQSQDFSTVLGIFLTTFFGSVLFAWLFVEWNYNLWISIFLHLFMNLYWILFSVSDNAFGNLTSNIYRVTSILLVITITVFYKKKKGIGFEVNKKTLLKGKATSDRLPV